MTKNPHIVYVLVEIFLEFGRLQLFSVCYYDLKVNRQNAIFCLFLRFHLKKLPTPKYRPTEYLVRNVVLKTMS